MSRLLSPRDLADALGVSESSLKRWIDAGRIRATRTSGGHRRIALDDAIVFIREAGVPVQRPELLGIAEPAPTPVLDQGAFDDRALYRALVAGDARLLQAWIAARRSDGTALATLCDGPIREAMHAVGELWQHDPDGVFIEHRATDLCVQALAALRGHQQLADDAPLALGCAPEDDPYLVPSTMAALVLEAEGYRTINLGPDTPTSALHRAVRAHRPTILWISASSPLPLSQAGEIASFIAGLPPGVTPVIGGRNRHVLAEVDRTMPLVVSMKELATIARKRKRELGSAI